jgi:hypothetical protein
MASLQQEYDTKEEISVNNELCILCNERPGIIYSLHCEVCDTIFGHARLCEQAIQSIASNRPRLLKMFNHSH